MSSASPIYTPAVITDLTDRTEYEAWLLEAVYEIAKYPMDTSFGNNRLMTYPSDGSDAQLVTHLHLNEILGSDWRPKFLEVGAPLVLVTSFKLLDMLIEWVLEQNGKVKPGKFKKFQDKIKDLKGTVVFPTLIESRPWLRERLISLYEELDPLRGTIIHERYFQSTGGTLQVSSSRKGVIGPVVTFSSKDLRNLARFLVSLVHHLDNVWTMGLFQEKQMRYTLDQLTHLHRLPSLEQLLPDFLTVQIYVQEKDLIEIDLDRIRNDLATKSSGDALFEVRVVVIALDGQSASAYMIGCDELQQPVPRLQKRKIDLKDSEVAVPDGIDPQAIARDLGLLSS